MSIKVLTKINEGDYVRFKIIPKYKLSESDIMKNNQSVCNFLSTALFKIHKVEIRNSPYCIISFNDKNKYTYLTEVYNISSDILSEIMNNIERILFPMRMFKKIEFKKIALIEWKKYLNGR